MCGVAGMRRSRSAQPTANSQMIRPSLATATTMDGTVCSATRLRISRAIRWKRASAFAAASGQEEQEQQETEDGSANHDVLPHSTDSRTAYQWVSDPSGRLNTFRRPGCVTSPTMVNGFMSVVTPRPGRWFVYILPFLKSKLSGR